MVLMHFHTRPRVMPARYVRLRDQVAFLTTGDGGPATQVRTVETADRGDVLWLEVVAPPALVAGAPGVFTLGVAERRPDGTHSTVYDLGADESQTLVIRERVTVSDADMWETAATVQRDPAAAAVVDFLDTRDGAAQVLGAGAGMCGRWVDYGRCALGAGHPADMKCATRNDLLAAIVGEATEGHPATPGGSTGATVPAPRRADHDEPAPAGREHLTA